MTVELDTRYGALQVPDADHDVIGRFLARFGEWAALEVEFIADNVPDGAKVLDVGAFVGTFGIGLSQRRDLGSVVFAEANSELVPLLRSNADRNCRASHTVIDAPIVVENGQVGVGRRDPQNIGSTSLADTVPIENTMSVAIPNRGYTLDRVREDTGPFDLLKLDVEGLEAALIASDRRWLAENKPIVWAECNEDPASIKTADLLIELYPSVFYVALPSFNPENHRGSQSPIFGLAYESGLIAMTGEPSLSASLRGRGCFMTRVTNGEELRDAMWRTPRWVPDEWSHGAPVHALAQAIHCLRGEGSDAFLTPSAGRDLPQVSLPDWSPHAARHLADMDEVHQKIFHQGAELEAALRENSHQHAELEAAQRESSHQHAKLDEMERRSARQHAEIEALQRTASQQGAEIEQLRRKVSETSETLNWTERLADERLTLLRVEREMNAGELNRLVSIENSTVWRSSRLLRDMLSSRPGLRALILRTAKAGRGVVRLGSGRVK